MGDEHAARPIPKSRHSMDKIAKLLRDLGGRGGSVAADA